MKRSRGNTPIKEVGSKKSKNLDPVTLTILIKRAHEVYGVVLDKEGEVDEAATFRMRKRLKERASVT